MTRRQGLADSPLLIGTGAVLVALVLVVLAYNANNGLPFVPTYDIKADLPSGANLVQGNDVRLEGARIGIITEIKPKQEQGKVYAEVSLKLDKKIEELPVDTTMIVRPRSAIGLKYLELIEGRSSEGIPFGGKISIANAKPHPVELDEFFNVLNGRTRENNREIIEEFGNTLAGRGLDINNIFSELDPLLKNLEIFSRSLSDPGTRLARFFRELGGLSADVAPVAEENGQLFVDLDTTLTSLATVTGPIQQTIERSPAALDVYIRELPKQRPYIQKLTAFSKAFEPGFQKFPQVSYDLSRVAVAGTPAVKHFVRSTPQIQKSIKNFGEFAANPLVPRGLKNLRTFVTVINDPLQYIAPAQTVCNYGGLLVRNLASLLGDRDGFAGWLRTSVTLAPIGANSEGGPSAGPANLPNGLFNTTRGNVDPDFLHSNPYPNTASPGQPNECEAGNEVVKSGSKASLKNRSGKNFLNLQTTIGNVPGDQGNKTQDTVPFDNQKVK